MLSVIIPVYNAEQYLIACLDSLANQSYKDLEVLMIDDGSKDNSPSICDEYDKKFFHFRAIHKENGGCSSARNLGLKEAKGDLIAFVDADDCLDHDMYEVLVDALRLTDSDIAACTYKNEYREKFSILHKQVTIPAPIEYIGIRALESMTEKTNSIEGFVWNKIWKREVLMHAYFRTDVSIVDDAVFTWENVSKIGKACYVGLPMYHYRIIPTSITRNSSLDKYFKAIYGYELMISDADKRVSSCLDGLCTDYIIWNLKLLEQLILSNNFSEKIYLEIKNNIKDKKEYIKKCGFRHRVLANSVLYSWKSYKWKAKLFWELKQMYFKVKR